MINSRKQVCLTTYQAGLLGNKPMKQKHGRYPKTEKQWRHETHILPSELSKLMIPTTCSLHTKERIICRPSLTMKGQENSPAQSGGGDDDGSMTSTQERQRSSSLPPHFSFDYKTVVQ